MERELKFRAWYKSSKKMVYQMTEVYNTDDREMLQFSGIVDKNKKDIYEGDIVCHISKRADEKFAVGVVDVCKWNGFGVKLKDESRFSSRRYLFAPTGQFGGGDFAPTYYVIGNIFENPELLKK